MSRRSILLLALALFAAAPSHAQRTDPVGTPRICESATIDRAVRTVAGGVHEGYGSRGVCSFALYAGIHLDDQEAVTARAREVFAAKKDGVCLNPQLNEAYAAVGQTPKGWGQSWYCDTQEYNGGRWNSVEELSGYVRARLTDRRLPSHGSPVRRR